jgi:hypothetical protein
MRILFIRHEPRLKIAWNQRVTAGLAGQEDSFVSGELCRRMVVSDEQCDDGSAMRCLRFFRSHFAILEFGALAPEWLQPERRGEPRE